MVRWLDLSINARVALCLIYAEEMIPKLKAIIERSDKAEKYSQGRQQINDILDLAWSHLKDKGHVDYSEMYALCSEGSGWTDDVKYGGYGYFDFVIELNGSNSEDSIAISNMLIFCFYYAMYSFAKRQNEKYLPQDIEWFDIKGSEAEAFSLIDRAISLFIPLKELQKIRKLTENLHKLCPFNQDDPYGVSISKEDVCGFDDI